MIGAPTRCGEHGVSTRPCAGDHGVRCVIDGGEVRFKRLICPLALGAKAFIRVVPL